MREYIVKFDTDEPPSNFPYGTNVRALMKITGDCDEVIRCKDCKWWKAEKEECAEWYDSPYAPADGYCFRAERRTE